MPLQIPCIRGPLTEWSDTLLVEGALPGATIMVRAIGPSPRDIAKGQAKGGRDRVGLLPGVTLGRKDLLLVLQEEGGEQSKWTPDHLGMPVGAAPEDHDDLSPLAIRTRLLQCGARVWITGASPGALVRLFEGATLLGQGQATERGDIQVDLASGLSGVGQSISASQSAPPGFPALAGFPATTSRQIEHLPVTAGQALPTPFIIGAPPQACDPVLRIGGLLDGAEVTVLHRLDASRETWVTSLDRLTALLGRPLDADDELEITQAMPKCGREWPPSEPLRVKVAPAAKPGGPEVTPPCPGATEAIADKLLGGAIVRATYEGVTYRGMTPPNATSMAVQIGVPMETGKTLEVTQERCALTSDPGVATVQAGFSAAIPPDIVGPLYECARVIRIIAPPKSRVVVWSEGPGGPTPITGMVLVRGNSVQLAVNPYLHEGQELWLDYLLCGTTEWKSSAHHWVGERQHLEPANIRLPLVEGTWGVTVEAVPGAAVDIFALRGMPITVEKIGSGFVDPMSMRIGLTRPPTTKELVYAVQWMCTERPGVGAMSPVLPAVHAFSLGASLKRNSNVNNPKPLVCHAAQVVLRHDGGYEFTADVENQETEADADFDLQFSLVGTSPPYGLVGEGQLSRKHDKDGIGPTPEGLATKGVPFRRTFSWPGSSDLLRDPVFWKSVVEASHKFEFFIAWDHNKGYPEEPDKEDPDDPAPPGP